MYDTSRESLSPLLVPELHMVNRIGQASTQFGHPIHTMKLRRRNEEVKDYA